MKRGDVFFADLDPTKGSEQQGRRPVVILQRDAISRYTRTLVVVPFTSSQVEKYRQLPSCVFIPAGVVAGLLLPSVALAHQIRSVDRQRLTEYAGTLPLSLLQQLERVVAYTLHMPYQP
jgi:mRNA interferase MazF